MLWTGGFTQTIQESRVILMMASSTPVVSLLLKGRNISKQLYETPVSCLKLSMDGARRCFIPIVKLGRRLLEMMSQNGLLTHP